MSFSRAWSVTFSPNSWPARDFRHGCVLDLHGLDALAEVAGAAHDMDRVADAQTPRLHLHRRDRKMTEIVGYGPDAFLARQGTGTGGGAAGCLAGCEGARTGCALRTRAGRGAGFFFATALLTGGVFLRVAGFLAGVFRLGLAFFLAAICAPRSSLCVRASLRDSLLHG